MTGLIMAKRSLFGVHHRDPPGNPDLVGREPDALGGVHRLEHVVDEAAHLLVHRRHLGAPLAEHRRPRAGEAAAGSCRGAPGAAAPSHPDDPAALDDHRRRSRLRR